MSQRSFQVERRGERQRFKPTVKTSPPKWTHQRELDAAVGKNVTLIFDRHVDDYVIGMLTATDPFTVQLVHGGKSISTYFKHSIRSYTIEA